MSNNTSTAPKTQYLLTGFTQEQDDRVFSFDGVGEDRVRVPVQVRIDTAMARRYGIRQQELPLLCRSLLDRRTEAESAPVMTFGEEEMCRHRDALALRAEADRAKRPPRRPFTRPATAVAAWPGV